MDHRARSLRVKGRAALAGSATERQDAGQQDASLRAARRLLPGASAPAMRYIAASILFAATFCYALGITMPLIEVKRLVFFTNEPSLIGMIASLWQGGDVLLAAIVALFSVLFPAVKLALLHVAAYGGGPGEVRVPATLRALAGWSMLDVLLVALVIFAAKTTGLATALTLPGLWFFAASVLLTATASALAKRAEAEAAE